MYEIIIQKYDGQIIRAKSYSRNPDVRLNDIAYCVVCHHPAHKILRNMYHGPEGIKIGSKRYKEIEDWLKENGHKWLSECLGNIIRIRLIDGRSRDARHLPWYHIDMQL